MAAAKMMSMRVPEELLTRVTLRAVKEGVTRTEWMLRAFERELGEEVGSGRATAPRSQACRRGPTRVDSVDEVRSWMAERQARLNASKDRAS